MFPRLLLILAIGLLALHVVHDATGFGGPRFDELFGLWFQPVVYLGCGAATLARAAQLRSERAPWSLLGAGLLTYGAGSVLYNLAYADAAPPFPSAADAMWLALAPAAVAAVALLVRRRFTRVAAIDWLDGLIGGAVVAAVVAAVCFEPVFDVTVGSGAAGVARFAYPIGDLISFGLVAMVLCLRRGRPEPMWLLLGAGFALLALADSVYLVEVAVGAWAPGGLHDLPYAAATMLLTAAAWSARPAAPADRALLAPRVYVPSAFALAAVMLAAYGVVTAPDPLTATLTLLALLAVVVRFGLTLHSLTRQRTKLAALAATDPLTGLANHRTLHERLLEELERAARTVRDVSVIALDLDHFKGVNDTYGHAEGDAALQAIARVLTAEARPYDLVGRMGGEEFTLIVPGAGGEEAVEIAERCRSAIASVTVGDRPVSCSAGVASFPEDGPQGHRLFELADGALYVAKQAGRDQVRRYDASQAMLLSRAEQQAQIRDVLDRDALTIVFQPIVELTTGRIGGYEALTRFLHTDPVRPPDQWFAQARRCGMGPELEARAIAAALATPGRPAGTFVSINVSPGALLSPEVAAVLPADLSDLVIELTEDERFSTEQAFDLALAALRERGARIAVDDAGAGYAGLQQLVRIRPEILKLDRSLVQGLRGDEAKIALLDALARFATTTGAAVCAEGIEDLAELDVLARFDVTYAQGFGLGRPAAPWAEVPEHVLAATAAEQRWGVRVATPGAGSDGDLLFGDVLDVLTRVATHDDLDRAMELVRRHTNAEDIAVSRVHAAERFVETLSEHLDTPSGKVFSYEDFPSTERVIDAQLPGQVVDGDPAADAREVALLRELGFGSVLMVPIVLRSETIGLLELYRGVAQAWVPAEIDRARLVAHQLAVVIGVPDGLRA